MKISLKINRYISFLSLVAACTYYSLAISCPITVSGSSSTQINDSGQANCVITINDGASLTTGPRAIQISGAGSKVVNFGSIVSGAVAITTSIANIDSVTNSGTINSSSISNISITSNINSINNSGTIANTSNGTGINILSGIVTNLVNTNTISGRGAGSGVKVADFAADIVNFTNVGAITGGASGYGVHNVQGGISIFNNGQGGNSSSPSKTALTYYEQLPNRYNIIVRSPSQYGQMVVTNPSSSLRFGIYAGDVTGVPASTLTAGTYSAVFTGLSSFHFSGPTSGTYGSYDWVLNNVSGRWDGYFTAS